MTPELDAAMFALRTLMLAGERFRHAVADHFGVRVSETVALTHLSMSGPLSPRQVADKVGLTPSTITALLDRLERAGLAERTPHPSDRRKTVVTITESGVAMIVEVQQWLRGALGSLEQSHLPDIGTALSDLAAALARQTEHISDETERRD